MPMTSVSHLPAGSVATDYTQRLFVILLAVGLVTLTGGIVVEALNHVFHLRPVHSENPFGPVPGYARAGGPISATIAAIQAYFYAALTTSVQVMKTAGSGAATLAGIGFLYGIFHAAGPGHGKAVITGYVLVGKHPAWSAPLLSLSAALLQAIVAICIVGLGALVLGQGAGWIENTSRIVEISSLVAITGLGAALLWQKAGAVTQFTSEDDSTDAAAGRSIPAGRWQFAYVILAAGIRPCSGALLLLMFSLSQGIFWSGVLGALSMAMGTAITTSTISTGVVLLKKRLLAVKRQSRTQAYAWLLSAAELGAAALVFLFGLGMLLGTDALGFLKALD